jgi:hypothetical protein
MVAAGGNTGKAVLPQRQVNRQGESSGRNEEGYTLSGKACTLLDTTLWSGSRLTDLFAGKNSRKVYFMVAEFPIWHLAAAPKSSGRRQRGKRATEMYSLWRISFRPNFHRMMITGQIIHL